MPFLKLRRRKKTAFLFPGQGTQVLGMAEAIPAEILDELREQTKNILGENLSRKIFFWISSDALKCPLEERERMKEELRLTHHAQLAVFLVSYAKWLEISRSEDFQMPDFMLGHSLGECTAVCASGAMNFPHALSFVFYRGGLMYMATILKQGGMRVVRTVTGEIKNKAIEKCLKSTDVEIANYNTPKQLVISGGQEGLGIAELKLKTKGFRVSKINVAGAFHNSIYMASVKKSLEEAVDKFGLKIQKPAVPVIFNFTGAPEEDPKRIKSHLIDQPVNTVRWQQSIERLIAEGVSRELIKEIGPGNILTEMLDDFPGFANLKK